MITVTITAVRYDDVAVIPAPTLLDPDATATVAYDNLVATITVGPVTGHELHFKPEAIADRIVGYSLDEETHAVEALVRELVFMWLPALEPADPESQVDVNGGIDARITVVWTADAKKAAAAVLEQHGGRVAAARADLSAAEPPQQQPVTP